MVNVSVSIRFSAWVRWLLAAFRVAPWAFRWIGVDRIVAFVGKYGMKVELT